MRQEVKMIQMREDTCRNLEKVKKFLGLKSYDEVVFYLTHEFLEDWRDLGYVEASDTTQQSILS